MAHTNGGQVHLTKAEARALSCLKNHILKDISYFEGGTFYKGNDTEKFDEQEAKRAQRGVELIDFILEASIIK